ncbi:DUF1059 domain-containing protein [Roseobacteraceae bacterium S113]
MMTFKIACGALFEGCAFTAEDATKEGLLQKVAAHAAEVHRITEVTPELVAQLEPAISEVP